MRNRTLTGRNVPETPKNWAKDCQVYGQLIYQPARTWHQNRARPERRPGLPPMMFAPTESVKRARTVGHKSKPFQKEEAVISRYFWRGILVFVLGAALVQSAAAQARIGAAVSTGSGMPRSFEDIAFVLVIAVMYLHELFRILTLCQFAAPVPARSAEATNQSAQPPRHGTPNGATAALRSVAKKTGAEMSLLGTLVSLSRKFG
jgi:hypothetical protein